MKASSNKVILLLDDKEYHPIHRNKAFVLSDDQPIWCDSFIGSP